MKKGKVSIRSLITGSLCCVFVALPYTVNTNTLVYAYERGEHHREHFEHRDYRHYRYYPSRYYYRRRIYYLPFRRYYYYYDVFPGDIYYFNGERNYTVDNPDYLPITSIALMGSQGVPDDVIIDEIKRTHSIYKLDSQTISYLKQNNVSDKVIDYMLNTGIKR